MDLCNSVLFTDHVGLIPPKAYAENSGKKITSSLSHQVRNRNEI